MKYKLLLFAGLAVLLTAVSLPAFTQTTPDPPVQALTYTAATLPMEQTITAPFPFNAVVPEWQADVPETAVLEFRLRTSQNGQNWSDWITIHPSGDWTLPEDDKIIGDMLAVSGADGTHQYIQVQIVQEAGKNGRLPQLHQLSLIFLDTTNGPTTEEMVAQQAWLDARQPAEITDNFPRPAVVSRSVWCIYDTCGDTTGLEYEPVTNMILHHTVSSNDSPNWAATVRAIYIYHRDTRGWGDIGYNYLVDRTGVIYEGHMNEDYANLDVIGIHAAAANAGGLGTALLGTFTTQDEYPVYDVPPPVMMAAVADLFAWKADQRGIDIYDATRMVNTGWGLPNIMGHRDVYGGTNTLCPGGNAMTLLPALRDAVAGRIGQVSPYTFVSEEGPDFTKANAVWHEAPRQCGWQGHAYYTWSTMDEADSTNWGEWQLNVPESGLYEIQVYAPYCDTNNSETEGATYEIRHGGSTDTAVVSHEDNVGLWMSLGTYQLNAGESNVLRLTDLTTTDSGLGVWFDDIRFKPVDPASEVNVVNTSPADGVWLNQPAVPFQWSIDNPTAVQTTTLNIAANAAFTDIITTTVWSTAVTTTTHTFTQDAADLYWRVSVNTSLSNTVASTPTRFGLDTTAPESAVTALQINAYAGTIDVGWQGTDALSGVTGYNLDYKLDGDPGWTRWLTGTLQTTAVFTPTNIADHLWFRSQAADAAGNVEAESSGDLDTDAAAIIFNPAVTNTLPGGGWQTGPDITFSWVVTEISDIQNSAIEVATDDAFTHIVASGQTGGSAISHTLPITAADGTLYWRVQVDFTPPISGLTSTVVSAPSSFGVDSTPPSSMITAVYTVTNDLYLITTVSSDAHSGVSHVALEYQAEGESDWTPCPNGAAFRPPEPGRVYYLRSQATDNAGNVEPPHAAADIDTSQAIPVPHAIMLPVIAKP